MWRWPRKSPVAGQQNHDLDRLIERRCPAKCFGRTGSRSRSDPIECAVCLSRLQEGETIRELVRCGHVFHKDCVDTWLRESVLVATCPLCRTSVFRGEEEAVLVENRRSERAREISEDEEVVFMSSALYGF